MKPSPILLTDASINLMLGVLLLTFPKNLVIFLGVPGADVKFYPSILGAVLFGIGIALLIECFRTESGPVGLGVGGAVAINLVGGVVLAAWLFFGNLGIPLRGILFLWALAVVLVILSIMELLIHYKGWESSV